MTLAVSITAKSRTITNGTANDGSVVEAEMVELYNNDDALKTGVNAVLGTDSVKGNIDGKFLVVRSSFSGTPASGEHCGLEIERGSSTNVAIRWNETNDNFEFTQDGTNYHPVLSVFSADPGSPIEGDLWYNSTSHVWKYKDNSAVQTIAFGAYPTGFHGSAPPVYASSSTFTIAYMRERSADDTVNLTKTGSTTISTATLGAVSGIAQSANQTGTCSTSGSSTTLTFSGIDPRTIFQVGDVVAPSTGAGPRRITALSSTTATLESALTVTASSTYKRGGLAPNTHYYLYAISDGTTPGWILSTRAVALGDTLVDLPTNYSTTTARQIPFAIRTDGSSNIIPFVTSVGWPYRPLILYRDYEKAASPYQMLSGGTQTSFTAVSLATLMPSISKLAELYVETSGSSSGFISIRATGSGLSTGHAVGTVVTTTAVSRQDVPFVMTDSSQSIDYKTSNASANPSIDLRGYWVTEVP